MQREQMKTILAEAMQADFKTDPWDTAVATVEAQGLRRAFWATLSMGQKLKLIAEAIESAKFGRYQRMMDYEPDTRTDEEVNRAVGEHLDKYYDYCDSLIGLAHLQDRIDSLGYWWQMRSPFHPGDNYWAGITPHNTTGWNGTPDHWTPDTKPGRALAIAFLRLMEERAED